LTVSTVSIKDVTKVWPDGTLAVDRVSIDVNDGEFMVLLGPSGCGKSTILRMIAGLEDPSSGDILLNGEPVLDLAPRDRKIAMVFQDFALYPHMSVSENIGFPLKLSGIESGSRGERVGDVASGLRAELRAEITGLTRELGVTTLYVTHDQAEALTMADRVAILRKGVLQDLGTPTEVYSRWRSWTSAPPRSWSTRWAARCTRTRPRRGRYGASAARCSA
jgi:multiple sugar transport system ATP-binding protein